MADPQRIGIFGGTFDPIHFGHITLAVELMEFHKLDEVWFCPANQNPHKKEAVCTPSEHRLKMVQLAIDAIPGFQLVDLEAQRDGPSYTVNTLEALVTKEKNSPSMQQRHFFLMLADDVAVSLPLWHRPEDIVAMVSLLVGRREKTLNIDALQKFPVLKKAVLGGLTKTSMVEISATALRKRICQKQYCGHLTSGKVLDYIAENSLYLL